MPLQKIPKEKIMAAIAKIGPSQPIDIRKELHEGDSFLIGAMLSELVAEGKLLITKVRRGGSPFYYDPLAPESLDKASQWLNEKDKRTYAMLKEAKVLREDEQQPLVRVGLQNMPDFSKRIEIDGTVYWRHYLISDEEAMRLVTRPAAPSVEKAADTAEPEAETESEPKPAAAKPENEKPAKKPRATKRKATSSPSTSSAASSQETLATPAETPTSEAKDIPTETPKDAVKEAPGKKPKKGKKAEAPVMMPDGAVMISPQEWLAHDTLYEKVKAFAGEAALRDARVHKPHSELTCIMAITTQFGSIDAFVHAFNRKFTPEDIKASMPRARELGLPIIILSVDPVPTKVSGAFKGMPNIIFKRMG